MRTGMCMLLAGAMFTGSVYAQVAAPGAPAVSEVKPEKKKPIVQIAILLDTSGSMEGLIEQAKTQLWKIVNEFATARRDGMRPEIEVALYHYGTPSLGQGNGYIKMLVPLTNDLDKISEELFKLRTDGGDEYCGAVIRKAAEELKWSTEKDAYKAIFIAGNEPFTQGSVKYNEACKEAVTKGIVVNTIFCGGEAEGIQTKWKDGALLADGAFMCIDQNAKVAAIPAPQDKEIAELSVKMNDTYIGYGKGGAAGLERQAQQEKNLSSIGAAAPAAAAERAKTKASGSYTNVEWDLVDARKEGKVQIKDLPAEALPEPMRKMDEKQREKYVEEKQKEREAIQAKITTLSQERDKYIAEQKKVTGEKTLDQAIIDAVHTQAKNAGMTWEAPK